MPRLPLRAVARCCQPLCCRAPRCRAAFASCLMGALMRMLCRAPMARRRAALMPPTFSLLFRAAAYAMLRVDMRRVAQPAAAPFAARALCRALPRLPRAAAAALSRRRAPPACRCRAFWRCLRADCFFDADAADAAPPRCYAAMRRCLMAAAALRATDAADLLTRHARSARLRALQPFRLPFSPRLRLPLRLLTLPMPPPPATLCRAS